MQIRVVTDQPWDVAADVLVIPFVGEPAFDGPVDELDKRSGGELRALAEIRELMDKEGAAKDRLPPDTRSLVLIMADIGQGGISDAAIDIEQAKADLDEALAPPVDGPAP